MAATIIDADVLRAWAIKQLEISTKAMDNCNTNFKLRGKHSGSIVVLESIIDKINELSTHTPMAKNATIAYIVGDRCIINIIGDTLVTYAGFADGKHKFIASKTTTYTTVDLIDVENIDMTYRSLSAAVVQEGDGWCYDLTPLEEDEVYHVLIESPREKLGSKATSGKKYYYQDIDTLYVIKSNLEENENHGDRIIAWQPLPPIPTRGDL
jgi:hypothetical protein